VGVTEIVGVKMTVEVIGKVGVMIGVRISGFSSATAMGVTAAPID
jgi:hypothetical protein